MDAGDNASPMELRAHWRQLVGAWVTLGGLRSTADAASISVHVELPEAARTVTVRFTTTSRLLVAFMTDGRTLAPGRLALAAAAANAWNTEQLTPMLSVWDVRGPNPCLGGVCTLPLGCRMGPPEFARLADEWNRGAGRMFLRCHQVFKL